jgi:hypothetical protein
LREHYFTELSNTYAANEGISANFSFSAQGELLIWTMDAPCVDDLPVARSLAREIGAALEHEETAALAQSIAVANVRTWLRGPARQRRAIHGRDDLPSRSLARMVSAGRRSRRGNRRHQERTLPNRDTFAP